MKVIVLIVFFISFASVNNNYSFETREDIIVEIEGLLELKDSKSISEEDYYFELERLLEELQESDQNLDITPNLKDKIK